MKKTVIFILLSAIFLSIFSPLSVSASYNNEIDDLKSDIIYIVSLDNDEVIFDKNYDKKAAPASLTKIMTALIALENCKDLTKKVPITNKVFEELAGTGSSVAGLMVGEQVSLQDLLYCLMIASANDAAIAIAQAVGGSVEKFVDMMNQRAKELGCTGTHFSNVHGLDDANHYTTAKDLAIITKEALKKPIFEKIVSCYECTILATNKSDSRYFTNTNFMMNPYYDSYYLSYVSGIKTGTTDNAGKCIITKASQNGYSYLAVVMGGKDKDENGNDFNGAFADCKKALKWTYNNIKYKVIAEENQTISVSELKYCWKTDHVRLVPVKEAYALVPSTLNTSSVYFELSENLYKPLKASIKKGETVGTATAYYGGNAVATIDLTVEETVHYSFLLNVLSILKAAWSNLFGKIVIIALILSVIVLLVFRQLVKKKIIDVSQAKYNRQVKKHLK